MECVGTASRRPETDEGGKEEPHGVKVNTSRAPFWGGAACFVNSR